MNSPRPTFGYRPDLEWFEEALVQHSYERALVLDAPVRAFATSVGEWRVLRRPEVELPEGVYWFDGIEQGSLILQVPVGSIPGGSSSIPLDELTEEHPLMSAWAWAEELWSNGTRVPAPQFEVNEPAVTHPGADDVVILDRKFPSSEWTYTVFLEGRQQNILESRLKPMPILDGPRQWVTREATPATRFGATLTRAKLEGKFANTLFSFRATRTTFRPYQFKPVLKLLQSGKARLLIADEVGLGKTIEAGLIWTELEARQEADRVLVVCPSGLLGKWKEEMADRFDLELTELDSGGLKDFAERHRENRLPRRQAFICSLERLRTWNGLDELREFPPAFDLVIVDEAHSMRNRDTKSYSLGTELSEWADNLVFLTATPINLRQEDLLNLLELLAPEDYGDVRDLELRLEPNRILNEVVAQLGQKGAHGPTLKKRLESLQSTVLGGALMRRPDFNLLCEVLAHSELSARDIVEAKRYISDLNTLSTVITRTKKVEVDDRKAKRSEDRQQIIWTAEELDFYEEYFQWCLNRARSMGRPLYFAMQMPLRLASACLPMARRAVLDPESFGNLADEDSDAAASKLQPHHALVVAAQRLSPAVDTKFDLLHGALQTLHGKGKQALLFTHSRPTLEYLRERLAPEFRVAVMHGGVSRDQRRRIMAEFRSGQFDFVLANRVASEGLDFEFCSAVINYDLPWNPMEIEQRIGRIDRIGQPEETILVINFVNESTIDERILSRLLDRIEIFESSIGALEPIISENAARALQDGFDFELTEQQREQKLHEVLTALEEQRAGARDVSDASSSLLVSNDVDVAGLEDDLVRTGRYIGQQELAHLLDDWARIDGASPLQFSRNGETAELRGNSTMAARVDGLAKSARRTRLEIGTMAHQLRSEHPIHLVLDQESARTGSGMLLTSTNPLVMAATTVLGHKQARFASLEVTLSKENEIDAGVYVIVLAKAISAARGSDEIWGAAVSATGARAGDGPVDALLAALAEGRLLDSPLPRLERLPALAERALNELDYRHQQEQGRRDRDFTALNESRLLTLDAQYERKTATIRQRIQTATERNRGQKSLDLFNSQLRRTNDRFKRLQSELRQASPPEIRLEPLVACVLKLTPEGVNE